MRSKCHAGTVTLVMLMSVALLSAQSIPFQPNLSPEARRQLELQARIALMIAKQAKQPKIECGMTVVPADPKVDPQAVKPVPKEGPTSTIRKVPPVACR